MPEEQKVTRKLKAILSADVKGYSLLMADDEVHTIQTLKYYRRIIANFVAEYSGRVVDSPGDNILAEFSSAVDAVECAAKIQGKLAKENSKFVEEKKVQFRIGVNVGDVVEDGDRIYGNGVNVAARIEGLAEPGGICISRNAYDHISDKLNYGYEYLGEHTVKNIKKPVRVYKLLMAPEDAGKLIGDVQKPVAKNWVWATIAVAIVATAAVATLVYQILTAPDFEPASLENMAFSLPEKPSIAVLPFNNLSGDSSQDYIADGITENIISDLSNISDMFVIARNSTFTYKDKPVKVQKVSEELGVRYVLEGSTQKFGNRVRVTAQLIDATTGHHLWSEKYDRDMKDLFVLQDEITHKIIVELQVKLTEGEQARVSHKSTSNLEAWGHAARGLKLFERSTKENNAKAMDHFKQAVELDPDYVWAWVRLAWTHVMASKPGWSPSPSEHWKKVFEISDKVLAMDENDSDVRALLGLACLMQGKFEKAINEGEISLTLGPTNAQAHVLLAVSMNAVGRFDDVIRLVKRAMRLHPYYPAYYLQWLGVAYLMTERYEDALPVFNQLLDRSHKGEFRVAGAHLFLAELYAEIGKEDLARTHATEILKTEPDFSLKGIQRITTYFFKDPALLERRIKALRKAGIPEQPPLQFPDKPSIAVLPFDNLSDDPEQEYFSDGMTDDIITDLSKIKDMLVISRNSTFTYKGKDKKIPEIAKELNVRYVLEGSVRKSGDQIRINAQLIDAKTDHHVWADRFDGVFENIFSLQDQISSKIVSALAVKLSDQEQKVLAAKGTFNIPAHDAYLKGIAHMRKFTPEDYIQAIRYFKQAIELDQNYSEAYASLSYTYWSTFYGGKRFWDKIGVDFPTSRVLARHYLKLAMKKPTPRGYMMMGIMELYKRNFTEAIEFAQTAASISPNNADILHDLGTSLILVERLEEGIQNIKNSIILDPLHKSTCVIGAAYFAMGDYEKTVKYIDIGMADNPERIPMLAYSAASHAFIGNDNEAKKTFEKWLTCFAAGYPTVQILYYLYVRKNIEVFDRLIEGLIKAGLKADPSDYCKVEIGNKMNGHEIRELSFGKTMIGNAFGFTWSVFRSKDGKTERPNIFGGMDKGISWIEGDSICSKMELRFNGFKSCSDVYRNPEGDEKTNSAYLSVTDYGIYPFSVRE